MPLALRIAAERANTHPTTALTDLVAELADYHRRLDRLETAGDLHATVRAVLSWSYQRLPAGARRTFRLLALHPGTDMDSHAVAALADITAEQARQHLETLTRTHLTHRTGPDRHGLHDLLRAYATHRGAAEDAEPDRQAAMSRLLDHFVRTTAAAWLDTEYANLLTVASDAARNGRSDPALGLSAALRRQSFTTRRLGDAHTLHTQALALARETGDHHGQLHALRGLGHAHYNCGAYELSLACFDQALTIARTVGDRGSERAALNGLGQIHLINARYEPAIACFDQSITVARDIRDPSGELLALRHLETVRHRQGRQR